MYVWMLDIEGDVWILLQEWTGVEARVVWCMARVASALFRVHVSSDCHSNILFLCDWYSPFASIYIITGFIFVLTI